MPIKSPAAIEHEKRVRRNKIIFCVSLVFVCIVMAFSFTPVGRSFWKQMYHLSGFGDYGERPDKAPVEIHVIDVGKADAILLECEGEAALLDAGTSIHGNRVADYLARQGIESLKYAIMSHPDKDHIGGMPQVLWDVPVDSFVQAQLPDALKPKSEEFTVMNMVLEQKAIPTTIVEAGDVFYLGGAKLSVIAPIKIYDETNDYSLVIKLEYKDFSALFCGDIEKEAEKDLAKSSEELDVDLLKVPHHGSKTSCTKRFLKAVMPEYAVISVGPDKNNLPNDEPLKRLEEIGADIYRTDTDGTVVFSTDGSSVNVHTDK